MFKIFALSVMTLCIGCAQNAEQQVSDIAPLAYQLFAHTGMDSLPANDVTFVLKDKDFSGKGPVNRYFGKICDNIIILPIGSTMMAGPEHLMKYEHQFLAALDSALLSGIGTDTLRMSKAGVMQMVFVKKEEKQ